ncbi:MAG: hypothetical protein NTW61_05365 [Candidatus Melainabacteria bacterium]|jgi:proteic killer suppression protein|nr:hypothetical protein [Candidatus Melainabacteria bacterium]
MDYKVQFTKFTEKQLTKIPVYVKEKLFAWMASVEGYGLPETQRISGYHDEPLKGRLKGKRSVRLTLQWRLIYVLTSTNEITFIMVERITPHEYRH